MTEISREYGQAIFMLACEKDKKTEYRDALEEIKTAFDENPDFMILLSSPGVSKSERLSIIEKTFSGHMPEDVVSYLSLMCDKGRLSEFSESVEEYENLLSESQKVKVAKVTSAVELTEEEKTALTKKLMTAYKTNVSIEYCIDSSILGGVVVEMDGKVLDGSLRSRLKDIKEVINR